MDFILGLFSLWQTADAQKLNNGYYSNMNYSRSINKDRASYSQNIIRIKPIEKTHKKENEFQKNYLSESEFFSNIQEIETLPEAQYIPPKIKKETPPKAKYASDYKRIVQEINYKNNPFKVNYLPQAVKQKTTSVLPQPKFVQPELIKKPVDEEPVQVQEVKIIEEQKTTIIFAPHPDDEILCCSNKISNLLAQGEKVKVVILTDGDAHSDSNAKLSQFYGQKRRLESIKAARRLGLNDNDIYFLGFPDGYLSKLNGIPVTSKYTRRTQSPLGSYFAGTDFSRKNLKELISNIVATYSPDEVFIPSDTLDRHGDHIVTGQLVKEILREQNTNSQVSEYFIHGRNFAAEIGNTNQRKLNLIDIFQSQFHDENHRKFLEAFASIPELFLKGSGLIAKE